MSRSSLIIKAPRVRRAPNRYSPSPTTTAHTSRIPKRTPKKQEGCSTKRITTPKKKKTTTTTKPTPKKITKEKEHKQKQKKTAAPAIPTPSSPKQPKKKTATKPNTPQRTLVPTSVMFSNADHPGHIETPPFIRKFTRAEIREMESLVSPWYTVEDVIRRLKDVRKMLD